MAATAWRAVAGGLHIAVRLTPRGGVDRIEGIETAADCRPHLKARVRAAPEKGAANKALERLLAGWLGLPASAVAVTAGATARLKTVRIAGDAGHLAALLAARLDEPD